MMGVFPVRFFFVFYLVSFGFFLSLTPAVISSSDEASDLDESDFPNERNALIQLRDILNSTSNLHSNWTGPPCYNNNQSRWAGIGCTNGHVTRLALEGIRITSSIPPMLLQNVTFLSKLSLRNNSIYGPLPNLSGLVHLEFVFLSRNQFSGSIPFAYINLPKLSKLELQENYLQGPIPPFDQPTLIAFNVSHNQLQGPIPMTPVLQRFSGTSYDNNSDLCGIPLEIQCPLPPPIPPKGRKKTALNLWRVALIAAAAAVVPFSMIIFFLCFYRRNQRKENQSENPGRGHEDDKEKKSHWSESTDDPERNVELEILDKSRGVFDLDDLLRASAEVIGKGKVGTMYKAVVECGPAVAVKRVKEMNEVRKKEFVQQMQLIGKLKHENLVALISYHYAKEEKLLIFEYVSQGSLFQLLHENRGIGRQTLNWSTRVAIIKEIANGLNFLHQSLPSHKVPHGNLKSSNVLLHRPHNNQAQGNYYQCKLSDYGFLPLLPSPRSLEKLAVGKSPEFCQGKKLTNKADIYCFGILVLEIITGKIPQEDKTLTEEDLSDWVRTIVHSDWSTDILDMEIIAEKDGYDDMLKLTKIALECTDTVPEKRPQISEVLTRIQEF